ncbi:UNVERIFIED_ORG: hypothetical protein ABID57_000654 [Arthrobacter sp. UYEF1]
MSIEEYSERRTVDRNWRNRGGDVEAHPERNLVSRQTSEAEAEAAWVEDYHLRNGAAITTTAGKKLAGISREFSDLVSEDPGIAPGLATFEAAYISSAAQVIARYTMGGRR